ncbi:MAG: hypothetical protein HQ478_09720 [Chloroflexi bacterium]|nr:hypothetical protein [Chloroflexota bacterium]
MVGAVVGITALLLVACGSESTQSAPVVSPVAPAPTSAAQSQVASPTSAPEPMLDERLNATATMQSESTVEDHGPTPIPTQASDAESVVGSGVPTPTTIPVGQPDPPELGTPLINFTLPRAASDEVIELATFEPNKNIIVVFYRAFW